jgi:hypothetical protein
MTGGVLQSMPPEAPFCEHVVNSGEYWHTSNPGLPAPPPPPVEVLVDVPPPGSVVVVVVVVLQVPP